MLNRMAVLKLWQRAKMLPKATASHQHMANLALTYKKDFYDPVAKTTGIPWYVIAALDMREENFKHTGYLGNGDPLWKVTTHVPRGRGPFKTWFEGAIDALTLDHMAMLPPNSHWDIVTALIKCEGYNGMGYATKGLPSPYVWAGTTVQVTGKYVADGHFDPNAWDTQPGCAGLFITLRDDHNIDVGEA